MPVKFSKNGIALARSQANIRRPLEQRNQCARLWREDPLTVRGNSLRCAARVSTWFVMQYEISMCIRRLTEQATLSPPSGSESMRNDFAFVPVVAYCTIAVHAYNDKTGSNRQRFSKFRWRLHLPSSLTDSLPSVRKSKTRQSAKKRPKRRRGGKCFGHCTLGAPIARNEVS